MKFGVRECANVVFKAKQRVKIGTEVFNVGQPVLVIDTAKTSSLEESASPVYANGGRGNAKLMSWEGDKELKFTVEDALLSPIGIGILSGAGIFKDGVQEGGKVHFHMMTNAMLSADGKIDLTDVIATFGAEGGNGKAKICLDDAPIFIVATEPDGSVTGTRVTASEMDTETRTSGGNTFDSVLKLKEPKINGQPITDAMTVCIDYYVDLPGKQVWEIDITPDQFAGYYYVEADTLVRDQHTGKDMPANMTFPNVKIQTALNLSLSSTGDPSTFSFAMDAFPGYTYFDKTKKVQCVIQIVEDIDKAVASSQPVMGHDDDVDNIKDIVSNDTNEGLPTV